MLNVNMVSSWKQDWDKCLLIGARPRNTGREKVISWPVKYKITFSFFPGKSLLLIINVNCNSRHLSVAGRLGLWKAHTQ